MAQAVQPKPRTLKPREIVTFGLYAIAFVLFILWIQPYLADKTAGRMLQTTLTGILTGGVYALIALGIVVINKASGIFNFAHGYMMLIGGFVFFSLFTTSSGIAMPVVIALATLTVFMVATTDSYRMILRPQRLIMSVIAVIVLTFLMSLEGVGVQQWIRASVGTLTGAVLLGVIVERFAIRPLIGQPLFAMVMMTLAVGEMIRGITIMIWGSLETRIPVFSLLDANGIPQALTTLRWDARETFLQGIILIKPEQLIAFGLAIVAFIGFLVFFQFTNVGLAMRATAENQQLAQSVGLRVRIILAVAWGIAALMAAVAGVLQGGASTLSVNAIPLLALAVFPAVLLGGLESISGAMIGGLVLGLVIEWSNFLFANQVGNELAPFVVLMVVLVLRPDGLFGLKRIERI
ncbi:MAG: branched-chain amino acid ABC transporter permease [Anaerolineae bacterium]|nr:branched-chain amino acid ABC transporter permease [Anaerolineae bacterium]